MKKNYLIILICFFQIIYLASYSQIITVNDGFEGTSMRGVPPTGWNNCNDNTSTADTEPGSFGVTTKASEGKTFISLVTRFVCQPKTVETIWADLKFPLVKNYCYNMEIDLSLSHEFNASCNFTDYFFNTPCVLRMYGFNNGCPSEQKELLFQSALVTDFDWKKIDIDISPLLNTYTKIAFQVFFSPDTNYKNNVLLIDNLKYFQSENVFIKEREDLLLPNYVKEINWYFNGYLVPDYHDFNMPVMGKGRYKASFIDLNNCLIFTSEEIMEIDTESITISPNPAKAFTTINHYSLENINAILYIYDATGRIVLKGDWALSKGKNRLLLDLASLKPGCYFAYLPKTNNSNSGAKFLIGR